MDEVPGRRVIALLQPSITLRQDDVDAVCKKYGVPMGRYTAHPAGDQRASSPPPAGAVCVYAHIFFFFFYNALFNFWLVYRNFLNNARNFLMVLPEISAKG
jgi:hypothetical protein